MDYISVIQTCTFRFCWEIQPTALQLPLLPQVPEEQKVLDTQAGELVRRMCMSKDTHIPSII